MVCAYISRSSTHGALSAYTGQLIGAYGGPVTHLGHLSFLNNLGNAAQLYYICECDQTLSHPERVWLARLVSTARRAQARMPLKPRARQQNRVERQLSKIVTKDAYDTNFVGASAPLSTPLSTALVTLPWTSRVVSRARPIFLTRMR